MHKITESAAKDTSGDVSLEKLVLPKLRELVDRMDGSSPNCLHGLVIDSIERPLLFLVLKKTNGNQIRAAAMLGINRNTLRKKIRLLQIDVKQCRNGGEK